MATKKQLVNRWLEEPGRTIAARIRQGLIDYAELLRPLSWKAREVTGLYLIPKEWLPPLGTKSIFALLDGLPFREEIANGRDFRGIPSIGGNQEWDLNDADFSFLPGESGYTFHKCNLDGAIFDCSRGEFEFQTDSLRKTSFKKVRFLATTYMGVCFWGNCLECDFSGAVMKKAHFMENADLSGSCFVGANLNWARFVRCDLRGCDFQHAILTNAGIQESIIDRTTDFRGANLVGLSWQDRRDNSGRLIKHGSDWRQGTYDSTTIHD